VIGCGRYTGEYLPQPLYLLPASEASIFPSGLPSVNFLIANHLCVIYIEPQIHTHSSPLSAPRQERNVKMMARRLVLISAFACLCSSLVLAQIGTDAHTVTLQVDQITLLAVDRGSVNLSVDGSTAVPGQDEIVVSDQSSLLLWGTNVSARKVTASTSLAAPLFTLRLAAGSPSAGTPAPEQVLSTLAADFLRDIGRSSGSAQIRYTGVALASQGPGSDTHVITFTIVAQ